MSGRPSSTGSFRRMAQVRAESLRSARAVRRLASLDSGAMTLGSEGSDVQGYMPPPSLVFWARAYGAWGRFDGDRNAATASAILGGS